MPDLLQLIAGSEVRCTDGRVGHVRGLILALHKRSVTHLSVDASQMTQNGRIVPVDEVQSAGSVIQLACTRNDYYGFPENEELILAVAPGPAPVRHVHLVPHGETELKKGDNVHAVDGRAGHLVGVSIDRDSHTGQELFVQVGHFSGRHRLSIPFDAVTAIDEHGVHLRLSKDELSAQGA